ncbi:PP2C family serine/threonine-protein phosphatase [Alteribacillus bidgolensis]|uniref:Negative regulator of sigma-B (Phosphoserine phosphatase) n=1 Tax=Alteribacillus bidgolensis TaxID=930129 RepID=A0A1G8ISK2_9BACI|nr:PP2C family serine/threonine-protein phosphatase [Alteribacillus bidgolensis]SDI21998.1 negative regulator of sigma-B (phosphoserine phosphatase) [Alteribacillus bidgolensis]
MIENKTHSKVDIAAFQQEKKGNYRCGDAYVTVETDDYFICALADGLGSGEGAYRSAKKAMDIIEQYHHENVPSMLEKCNRALIQERGVVITILKACFSVNEIVYGNIGNIGTYLISDKGEASRPIPAPGYMSGRKFQYRLAHFPFRKGFQFLLHSDGITISQADQQWIKTSRSPECSIQHLSKKAKNYDDDTTIIAGFIT